MNDDHLASFWEHLDAFRTTLIRCLLAIGLGTLFALFIYPYIFSLLTAPFYHSNIDPLQKYKVEQERIYNTGMKDVLYHIPDTATFKNSYKSQEIQANSYKIEPTGYIDIEKIRPKEELIILSPAEGMVLTVKISFWVGVILSSPFWLFFIFQFVSPALKMRERTLVIPFLALSAASILIGCLFAYWITIPAANQYLSAFNLDLGKNLWSLGSYLNFSLSILLANGIAFESCIVLLFLVHFGILSMESLRKRRRHVIVGSLIVAALLTPPDVLTQVLLAVPLMIFYEFAILYAKWLCYRAKLEMTQQKTNP
jgi:sec-independent protein translocase protein TatC